MLNINREGPKSYKEDEIFMLNLDAILELQNHLAKFVAIESANANVIGNNAIKTK